jgi:hypothetical protein
MSLVRRLERFLSNGGVRVREWYEPIALDIIAAASVVGEIQLVLDITKVSAYFRLLMVGVAYRRRVLPLAWTWVQVPRGHSSTAKQVALLSYVRGLIPAGIRVSLVGDCEFGHTAVLEAMQEWRWDYALRQSGHLLVQLPGSADWVRLDSLISQRGDWRFLPRVKLTAAHGIDTNLMLCWDKRYKEPWLLATNLTRPRPALRLYHRRAWIENMFGDLKDNGFDFIHHDHPFRQDQIALIRLFGQRHQRRNFLAQPGFQLSQPLVTDRFALGRVRMDLAAIHTEVAQLQHPSPACQQQDLHE